MSCRQGSRLVEQEVESSSKDLGELGSEMEQHLWRGRVGGSE